MGCTFLSVGCLGYLCFGFIYSGIYTSARVGFGSDFMLEYIYVDFYFIFCFFIFMKKLKMKNNIWELELE